MAGTGYMSRWSWWCCCLLALAVVPSQQDYLGELQVRLQGGGSDQGRVQVRRNSTEEWANICGYDGAESAAGVICHSVDSTFHWGEVVSASQYGSRTGPVMIDSPVVCHGHETNLGQCSTRPWGAVTESCRTHDSLAVKCHQHTARLRPQFGSTEGSMYGAVEVLRTNDRNQWFTLCDALWDDSDARQVCKLAGYADGKALCCGQLTRGTPFSSGTGSNITCPASAASTNQCSITTLSPDAESCPSGQNVASAICYSESSHLIGRGFSIRLTSGSTNWGRVEVRHLGAWGTLCSTDDNTASMACREMTGHGGGVVFGATTGSSYHGSNWAANVTCAAHHSTLEHCVRDWGTPSSCHPMFTLCYELHAPTVQLVGSNDGSYGRVEITMDDSIFTVCDDHWTSAEANVVCRSKGYAGGVAIRSSHYGKGVGRVALSGVRCRGDEANLLQCPSNGWLQSSDRCNSHSHDASVYCHGPVMLQNGDHSNGVVQVMVNGSYHTICGTGFGNAEVGVVCRSLGFENGQKLPSGAYAQFPSNTSRVTLNCQGNEQSAINCTLSNHACASNENTNYAAVHCYNGSVPTGRSISLSGGGGDLFNSSGHVMIHQGGVVGRVCSAFWDDRDAKVACKQLGFNNGLAYGLSSASVGPFLIGQIHCRGTENSLFDCRSGNYTCTTNTAGSALCFNDAPQLQLVGGQREYGGRVEITYRGVTGTICVETHAHRTNVANVVCRGLGYAWGNYTNIGGGEGRVMLTYPNCDDTEGSIFGCKNLGFMTTTVEHCSNHNNDLGVYCFGEVVVMKEFHETNSSFAGLVKIFKHKALRYICKDYFGEAEAGVVCRQLGYSYHRVVQTGPLSTVSESSTGTVAPNCTGEETSLGSCPFDYLYCDTFAAVHCSKSPIVDGLYALAPTSQLGLVKVQADGLQSFVCSDQWDDHAAGLYCQGLGYSFGKAFGTQDISTDSSLVSKVNCTGSSSFRSCALTRENAQPCDSILKKARAFCFNDLADFQVHLVNGTLGNEGIVQIGMKGQWGTVCASAPETADANVVCRSLGFLSGDVISMATSDSDDSLSWIVDPECEGQEANITACHMNDFNTTKKCSSQRLAVRCSGGVKLQPNVSYGAVEMMVDNTTSSFGLVCADGFGPSEASVTCRDLGYPYGLQMSGSAFGRISSASLRIGDLKCSGAEAKLRECSYSDNHYCRSRKYASVVCSKSSPRTGYHVSLEAPQDSSYGRVKVQHMGFEGYVCAESFSNDDASVICKEAGYSGGIAFHYNSIWEEGSKPLYWLKHMGCTGQEAHLISCPVVRWGKLDGCSHSSEAAVYCYQDSEPQLHLVNGSSSRGRLELWTEQGRSTVCGRSWTDREASVACKTLGFRAGRFLGHGAHGQGTGDIVVAESACSGLESSLFDCSLRLKGQPHASECSSHDFDAAVQCFEDVGITGSSETKYGSVEVLTDQAWVAVCDVDFDIKAAQVVCRAMGYADGRPQCCSALGPLWSRELFTKTIGMKVNSCRGDESSLLDCDVNMTSTCSSGKYASVLCSDEIISETRLQVRPVWSNSYYTHRARLEVYKHGFWGPICNSDWDDKDANATCHGLGFKYGRAKYYRSGPNKPMMMGKVNCTGLESSLTDCPYKGMDDELDCFVSRDVVLLAEAICYNVSGDTQLRLANGGKYYGRLEVQFNGVWRDVLVGTFDIAHDLACQQLGFKGGRVLRRHHTRYSTRYANVWIRMSCKRLWGEISNTLLDCDWDVSGWWFLYTSVDIMCYNDVTLKRGNGLNTGLLVARYTNSHTTVCDNQWTDTNTRVACQNMGFDDGFFLCCGVYGHYWYPVADTVSCRASDTHLTSCPHERLGNHQTCRGNSVSVSCYDGPRPTNFTYSIKSPSEVIINFNGLDGHICSDGWEDVDAKVLCSELGYPFAQRHESNSAFGVPYWATNINCRGTENRLRDCQFDVGYVSECRSGKSAGVLCTNSEGIFYRLGSNTKDRGRVEMSINGQWGALCEPYFDVKDATAFCRSQGYREGDVFTPPGGSYPNPPSTYYGIRGLICSGEESSLEECTHGGWRQDDSCDSKNVARVRCYNDVRIGGDVGHNVAQGPVQLYHNGTWYNLCDTDFDDNTAGRVCRDLGFADGVAVCCSGYGSSFSDSDTITTHLNYSMQCTGGEKSSEECVKPSNCMSHTYASVVCFGQDDYLDEDTYTFDFEDSSKTSGVVAVTHMNVKGRVCNVGWDDTDARVVCKSKGFLKGVSFRHSQSHFASVESQGPFWVSSFNCTGNETSLNQCSFQDRLHLGNCSTADFASAVCYNDSGIQYRLSSDIPIANEGRVEIAVGGVWGTVCKHYWDDRDATVFCRTQGYTEGYSIRNTFSTLGSGPMWLSNMKCNGTETSLHMCLHDGFRDIHVGSSYYTAPCSTHWDDAYVMCVDKLKFNQRPESSMGAVMVYRNDKWNLICDSGLDHAGAQVVCRERGYAHGTYLQGSKFGRVDDAQIAISKVQCRGTESDFSACTFEDSSECPSGKYASVVCSHYYLTETTDNVRVVDESTHYTYGYLEYQVEGVWGAVCASTLDSNAASVACKQLGFIGGAPYKPRYRRYLQPILTSDLKCTGEESRLDECPRASPPASAWCDFHSPRAGVLCYNSIGDTSFQLTGDVKENRGRVEMQFNNENHTFCTFGHNNPAARVACRTLGYKDGMALSGLWYYYHHYERSWMYGLNCRGNESSILECSSSGFAHHTRTIACLYQYGPFSVECYQDEVAITKVRLADGNTKDSGRVEVFLSGPNEWGTVCDNNWNDMDATVVCNQMGYATGQAVRGAGFGRGKGKVWIDNVGCWGNETQIQDCGFDSFDIHNCHHKQDAGVICSGVYVPPRTSSQSSLSAAQTAIAVVVPIMLILIVAVVGFLIYRRRWHLNFSPNRHNDTVPTLSSDFLNISSNGVVRFFNSARGRGRDDQDISGVSNPNFNYQNGSNNGTSSAPASDLARF